MATLARLASDPPHPMMDLGDPAKAEVMAGANSRLAGQGATAAMAGLAA